MFDTPIHWTTFFYLLIGIVIVSIVLIRSFLMKSSISNKKYLILGCLFVLYNFTGGFLPTDLISGPIIIQYIITYVVAITLCVFIIYYIYKEYDIVIIKGYFTIKNIVYLVSIGFLILFLVPYYITRSLFIAKVCFTIPIALIGFYFLWQFYRELTNVIGTSKIIQRRGKLVFLSISSVVLLPVVTLIGDYQWITFSMMNIGLYAITIIEVDRYHYFLEHKHKIQGSLTKGFKLKDYELTSREIEIAFLILDNKSYKNIAKNFTITEGTVSKHASNVFKKTGTTSKKEFLNKFKNRIAQTTEN